MEPSFYTTVDRTFFYRVREVIDYGFVDERMAEEGALESYKVLLVYETDIAPSGVVKRISEWVRGGGILITINSRVSDYDGATKGWDAVAGFTEKSDIVSSGQSIELLEPSLLPAFVGRQCEPGNGASFLADNCRVLLRMGGDNIGRLAWMRQVDKGWVFAYQGPPNTDEAPGLPHKGSYKPPSPGCEPEKPVSYPVLFFRDVLKHLAGNRSTYGVELPSLWLGEAHVFLSETDRGLVALNVRDEEVILSRAGSELTVPGQAISLFENE
jgi:hypothetical protein